MRYKKLTLNTALSLEEQNLIKIYYPGGTQDCPEFHPNTSKWTSNYVELTQKYKKIPLGNILEFIGYDYIIDVLVEQDDITHSFTWVNLYGKDISKLEVQEQPKGHYVYILTNVAYPELVKIGKAVNPQQRIKGINGAGTLSEWVLKYAMPVTDDYKVENLMHRHFEEFRVDSNQGHSREFFKVDFDKAVKALEYFSQDYYNGEPLVY